MSYFPDQGFGTSSVGQDFGSTQGTDLLGATVGATTPLEQPQQSQPPMNLGPNIFPAQPGQLPPEAFNSSTPTVRTLPPKVVKNTLPPQYKTQNLPPKVVTTRLQPIFPPGVAPTPLPQF